MTPIDWLLLLTINGGIVAYGLIAFRQKRESFDWYLAAKSMPWWVVGLSAFGTAVDSGDYVAIAGGSYKLGLSQLSQWWLGIAVGWIVLSFFVIVPMYRSGVFTNAEWLEFRFGPAVRLLAVLINVQSRTNVLGNIFFSMFLILSVVAQVGEGWSWAVVVGAAATSTLYIIRGGLQAGAVAVPLMSVILMGIFTRVHRQTGIIGLSMGLAYGLSALLGEAYQWPLPVWYTSTWWTYLWNIVLPVGAMLLSSQLISLWKGPMREEELRGLVYARGSRPEDYRQAMGHRLRALEGTWLQKTLLEAPVRPKYPFEVPPGGLPWHRRPGVWACLYLGLAGVLLYVVLW